jgi:hypothetical protein
MISQGSITEVYPANFRPKPALTKGTYAVVWYILVSDSGVPSLGEVARDHFEVPSTLPREGGSY